MAIVQISRIQQRRGLNQDLPQLASGELAWSVDTRQLYIGNGTVTEGAPTPGVTEILTQYSIIDFTTGFAANIAALESNVAILQTQVAALGGAAFSKTLLSSSSGTIVGITANNAVINYTLNQGSKQRSGSLSMSRYGSTATYNEDYNETDTTDTIFSFTSNSSGATLAYSTTTASTVLYTISSLT